MATLKERLAAIAAKKAAEASKAVETVAPAPPQAAEDTTQPEVPISPLAIVEEPATQPDVSSKPMTFAEKMALKKKQIASAQVAPPPKVEKPPVEIDPATIPEDPEDAQAYVDIKQRIHVLDEMFDDELTNAMGDLKAALKKNPNAVSLMLYEDVGKMVTALRRMAGIQLEAKTTGKKPGRKKTVVKALDFSNLTPEEIANAVDF